jgi:AraC-like DNA-binding protein
MPSTVSLTFTDPDVYAAAIRNGTTQLTVTHPGSFNAHYVGIDLHNLWVQRVFDNLPRVSHGVAPPGRVSVVFRTRSGPSLLWRGLEIEPTSLVVVGPGTDYYIRSSGCASLGAVSLPADHIALAGATFAGRSPILPRDGLIVTSPPSTVARLRRLHTAAERVSIKSPEILCAPEAARGLEQLFIEAVINCISVGRPDEDNAARRNHRRIMQRFHMVLDAEPERELHLPDICALIGATEQTLRRCCREQLGISPKRFLLLRRMQLARRALCAGAPTATVTSVATRFGFWDLGRFASVYRSLFGESPSATLRNPA